MGKSKKSSPFRDAVLATPDVADGFCEGLEAFGEYKSKIKVPDPKKIDGSLDIDATTVSLYPDDNRWDYAICYDGEVFYIEVHSATTREVSKMIQKLQWIKSWLVNKAPKIHNLTTKTKQAFYWVQSSKCDIPKHMPQYKKIVQHKICPMPIWDYNKIMKQS